MKDKTLRRVLAVFAAISIVFVVVAIIAVQSINRAESGSDWVNHTHAVISENISVMAALQAADGAARTYVVTGDARDRAACLAALERVAEHIEVAKALTRREPEAGRQFAEVADMVGRRDAFIRAVLAERQAGSLDAVRQRMMEDAGGEGLLAIQRRLEKSKVEQMTLLAERDRAAYLQAQTTRWTVWSGVVLSVVMLGVVGWLIRDDIAARKRVAAALHMANDQLEARVKERTAELVAANERLSADLLERQWAGHALEHQLRYNDLIVNSISDLVFVLTKTTNISRVNTAVTQVTGFEAADLVNRPLAQVVQLVRDQLAGEVHLVDPVAHAMKAGRELRDQMALVEGRQGRQMLARFTLCPLRDRDKVVGGVVTLQMMMPSGEDTAAPSGKA